MRDVKLMQLLNLTLTKYFMLRNPAAEVLKPNMSSGLNEECRLLSEGHFLIVCETAQVCTEKVSDAGSHLSGLSDAQTESIIPTSNVP